MLFGKLKIQGKIYVNKKMFKQSFRTFEVLTVQNKAVRIYFCIYFLFILGDMSRARNALREALHLAEENEDSETKQLAESSIMKLEVDIS